MPGYHVMKARDKRFPSTYRRLGVSLRAKYAYNKPKAPRLAELLKVVEAAIPQLEWENILAAWKVEWFDNWEELVSDDKELNIGQKQELLIEQIRADVSSCFEVVGTLYHPYDDDPELKRPTCALAKANALLSDRWSDLRRATVIACRQLEEFRVQCRTLGAVATIALLNAEKDTITLITELEISTAEKDAESTVSDAIRDTLKQVALSKGDMLQTKSTARTVPIFVRGTPWKSRDLVSRAKQPADPDDNGSEPKVNGA